MIETLKKYQKPIIVLIAAFIVILGLFFINRKIDPYMFGAAVHFGFRNEEAVIQTQLSADGKTDLSERFQRPSKKPALDIKYNFRDFVNSSESVPVFKNPEDLIKAYFAILKDASNMENHHGGCGTIGVAKEPYPYAYKLLSEEMRKKKTLKQFTDSFSGTGHMTLLKILPAYAPPKTPDNIRYYFLEFEIITGPPVTGQNLKAPKPSYFAYYYGLITVENSPKEGWKIRAQDYIPEDFLCAPYHSWFWEAKAVVGIVYDNWYKLVNRIEKIEITGSIIRVYAGGKEKDYRFDFVQLTNGEHVLLHEYINIAGQWQETNILKDKDQVFKLSVLNPRLIK